MDAKTVNLVRGLLTSALEGGSNYWYRDLQPGAIPAGTVFDDYRQGGRCQPRNEHGEEEYWHWAELLPTVPGGSVTIKYEDDGGDGTDESLKTFTLDLPTLKRGLDVMQAKYPKRWAEAVDPDDGGDADTGDCFLQCCLFGDVIFG